MGAVVTLVAFTATVRVDRIAKGLVQVDLGERVDVPVPVAGRVASVDVGREQQVTAGQVVARLETAAGAVVEVPAPRAATVQMELVAQGVETAAGESVMALLDPGVARASFTGIFPGRFRSELAPGMPMEVRLRDDPIPIETVIEKVEGPEASARYLWARKYVNLPLSEGEGVVLVRASVPLPAPERNGQARLHSMTVGSDARVRLGTERLLVAWLPGLRRALP